MRAEWRALSLALSGFALLAAARPASAAPAELAGFPVRLPSAGGAAGVGIADLDADGKPEVILTIAAGLVVIDAAGKLLPGFPVELREPQDKGRVSYELAPAACDLDGNGKLELLVAAGNERLYAVGLDGAAVPGFPVLLEAAPKSAPTCVHDRKSGKREVAVVTEAGSLMVVPTSGGKARVVARLGKGAESGVATADLNGDGAPELVAVGGDSRLYVVDLAGKPLDGFPFKMEFRSSGTPAIGDVNDDGRAELVIGSQDFKIHAVDLAGKELPGFPVATEYRIYGGVALADLDRNGVLDIVVGSGDSRLYAVDGAGKALAGFPVKLDGRVIADPVVGDVDKDGRPEIAVLTQTGSLHVLDATGKARKGFPLRLKGEKTETAPALVDLNGDGLPELVVHDADAHLHAYTFGAAGKAEVALVDWPMLGHDAGHSGRFGPSAGRFKELGYANASPRTTDALELRYVFFDLDGDAEQDTQIRWYADGKLVPELNGQRSVPADKTRKHQVWSYTLQEGASFKIYGESGVLARVFRAPEIEIANTPAGAPQVELGPARPRTTTALKATLTQPSRDADGDAIQYRYVWLKDGAPQATKPDQTSIDPSKTAKGQEWRVVVVPFDGEVEGEPASALINVINTPPGAPQITHAPASPRTDEVVKISIAKPAPDDDRDAPTYTYRYWLDGVALDLLAASASLPPRAARKHQKVRVEVTAHDDEEAGGKAELSFTVQNTPPEAPQIQIWPRDPRTTDGLRVGVVRQAADADRDGVQLQHQWFVDGAPVDLPAVVPAERTKKRQKWRLVVTPFDGEAKGQSAAAEAVILNTPPVPPVLALDRYVFATNEDVAPRTLVPASDADGDAINLKHRWTRNGKPAGFPESKTSLTAAETSKGDAWSVEVIPNDGEVDGAPARFAFSIRNSPPTAPRLQLSKTTPTVRDAVSVGISAPSTDLDHDELVYRYRWLRDGVAVAGLPADKAALAPGEAKKGEQWRVEVRAFDGEVESEPALAELKVVNHRPDAPVVELGPARPKTTDDLACRVTKPALDPDGDPVSYRTRWLVDGKPLPLSPDAATLAAALTLEKQSWVCEVEAFDGELASDVVRSAAVTIENSPPQPAKVSIAPERPLTSQELVCQLDEPARDDDFDVLRYRYVWKVDGKRWDEAAQAAAWKEAGREAAPNRVPAVATRRGQAWECEVTPSDGEADGASARAQVRIDNSAPVAPRVAIKPERPVSGQDLACEVIVPATDADGDQVKYRYAWLRDGVDQGFAPTSINVPGRLVKAKDLWKCVVTPHDGQLDGKHAMAPDVLVGEAKAAEGGAGKQPGSSKRKRRR